MNRNLVNLFFFGNECTLVTGMFISEPKKQKMGNNHRHRVLHPDRELRAQHDLVAGRATQSRRQLPAVEHGRQHHHSLQQGLDSISLKKSIETPFKI